MTKTCKNKKIGIKVVLMNLEYVFFRQNICLFSSNDACPLTATRKGLRTSKISFFRKCQFLNQFLINNSNENSNENSLKN